MDISVRPDTQALSESPNDDDTLDDADEFVCLLFPQPFHAVGVSYTEFPQLSDVEVKRLLREAENFAATQ